MKKIILFNLLFFMFCFCGKEPEIKNLSYKNIIILSDLSSRIDNKPVKDIEEINKIIDFFKNDCVKPGEKIGDKSSIFFSSFSNESNASIDLNNIKNLSEKQSFINSTGKFKLKGLNFEIEKFKEKIKYTYSNTRNEGLDLISILIEKIENEQFIKKDTLLTNGIDTTFINFENNLYIFTDGYLEYKDKKTNNQFYFGQEEIKKIRKYCIENKINVQDALIKNENLGLPKVKKTIFKYINLHIYETHERDKNEIKQTYLYTLGLRDNEILEAVWRKWALESGFKTFNWNKY